MKISNRVRGRDSKQWYTIENKKDCGSLKFEVWSYYQNKGGWVVLGKVGACKTGCSLFLVGDGKPGCCCILLVGASKIRNRCLLWVVAHRLNVFIIELKKGYLWFSPWLGFHVKIFVYYASWWLLVLFNKFK